MHEVGIRKMLPPTTAQSSQSARTSRLWMTQTLLNSIQPSGLFLYLTVQLNSSPKNLLHAFPNGKHEGVIISGWQLTPKLKFVLFLYLFLRRGLNWHILSRRIGVHTVWRQLLYTHVILSSATNTLSNDENSSSGREILHERVSRTRKEYLDPRVCYEFATICCSKILHRQTLFCRVIGCVWSKVLVCWM